MPFRMNTVSDIAPPGAQSPVGCWDLFWTFFKISLLTLGGGLAMAAVMRYELVLKRRWLDEDDFMAEMSLATVVPGVIAVNLAYLQGRRLRGKKGSAAATLGAVLPSFCVILLIAWLALPYLDRPKVAAFFRGCAVAVAGQLAFTGFTFGRKLLHDARAGLVCLFGLLLAGVLHVHPVGAVLAAGALGYVLALIRPAPDADSEETMEPPV